MGKILENKTDAELTAIAQGIHDKQIYTDRHVRNQDDLPVVFMPLAFIKPEDIPDNPGMIYQYISKAERRGINEHPIFMSINWLSEHDAEIIDEKYRQIGQALSTK